MTSELSLGWNYYDPPNLNFEKLSIVFSDKKTYMGRGPKTVHQDSSQPFAGCAFGVGAPRFYRTMKHHVYFIWNFLIKIVFCNLRFHILFHLKSPRNLSNLQLRWVSAKTLRTVTPPKRFIASKAGGVEEEKKKKKKKKVFEQ